MVYPTSCLYDENDGAADEQDIGENDDYDEVEDGGKNLQMF